MSSRVYRPPIGLARPMLETLVGFCRRTRKARSQRRPFWRCSNLDSHLDGSCSQDTPQIARRNSSRIVAVRSLPPTYSSTAGIRHGGRRALTAWGGLARRLECGLLIAPSSEDASLLRASGTPQGLNWAGCGTSIKMLVCHTGLLQAAYRWLHHSHLDVRGATRIPART